MGEAVATVLVLDDDPAERERLGQELSLRGFRIVLSSSGDEACELLRANRIDVAVVEYDLPGRRGSELIQALKQCDPGLEIVVVSRCASAEAAVAGIKSGAFDFLAKPVSAARLWGLIDQALERRISQDVIAFTRKRLESIAMREEAEVIPAILSLLGQIVPASTHGLLMAGKDAFSPHVELAPDSRPIREWPVSVLSQLARESGGAGRFAPLSARLSRTQGLMGLPVELEEAGVFAAMAFPLTGTGEDLGTLFLLRTAEMPAFTDTELRKGQAFVDQIARVLHDAILNSSLLLAQSEIRASEARFRMMFNGTTAAIFVLDRHLIIKELNPAAERIFQWDRRAILNQSFLTLFDSRQFETVLAMAESPGSGDDVLSLELIGRRCNGDDVPIVTYMVTLNESEASLVAIIRDLSKERQMETELRHAQKLEAVGRLAAGIAHEINTPVQFIADSLYFLKEACTDFQTMVARIDDVRSELASRLGADPALECMRAAVQDADLDYLQEEIPKAFDRAHEGVERVTGIVRAMKDFARPDRREMVASDLNRGILSTIVVAQNEVKYVADVETQLGDLPSVVCHIGDLNQVFLNLIVNAAHAIEDGQKETGKRGSIRISTECRGDEVLIAVSDTGCGIPPEYQDKIFDPFFTTKEIGRGSGQGLAIVRSIVVDKHGGNLSFETKLNVGTTFFLRLPLNQSQVAKQKVGRGSSSAR